MASTWSENYETMHEVTPFAMYHMPKHVPCAAMSLLIQYYAYNKEIQNSRHLYNSMGHDTGNTDKLQACSYTFKVNFTQLSCTL